MTANEQPLLIADNLSKWYGRQLGCCGLRSGRMHHAALLGGREMVSVAVRVHAALVPEVTDPSS